LIIKMHFDERTRRKTYNKKSKKHQKFRATNEKVHVLILNVQLSHQNAF
jgi:hypothetical protein